MKGIHTLISIVPRGKGDDVAEFCRKNGLSFNLTLPAFSAAGTHFMDYLGLTDTEKDLVISVVQAQFSHEMLYRVHDHCRMAEPNTGIAMTIPITGVSGPKALRYLAGIYPPPGESRKENPAMTTPASSEEKEPEKTTTPGASREFDLIVTIVNRGFSDLAIEAAKDAGAKGSTILNARGTGVHEQEKFFAIAIQPEKEVILNVVHHNDTQRIMRAIIEAAGLQTEGRGLAFSLPVGEVAGIVRWHKADEHPPVQEPSE